MLKKLRTLFSRVTPAERILTHQPYPNSEANYIYNLLFCDDRALFRNGDTPITDEPWKSIHAESPDTRALETIASNDSYDSRSRVLAYNRLRELGSTVEPKKTFGVIVEVPVERGLDTLAAFSDGGVRYLNYTGKMSLFEGDENPLAGKAKNLVTSAQPVVSKLSALGTTNDYRHRHVVMFD
jgi:hypothetical protein